MTCSNPDLRAVVGRARCHRSPRSRRRKYPERPIKLMIAFSAGGVNDVVGRHWAERMKPLLGTVYVENQGGASGLDRHCARSPARRPTAIRIMLGTTSTMVLNPMTMARVPYDPSRISCRSPSCASPPRRSWCTRQCRQSRSRADRLRQGQFRASCPTVPPATGTLSNLAGRAVQATRRAQRPGAHLRIAARGPGITRPREPDISRS